MILLCGGLKAYFHLIIIPLLLKKRFGIEIEFTSVTRHKAATIVAAELNSVVERHGVKRVNYAVKQHIS